MSKTELNRSKLLTGDSHTLDLTPRSSQDHYYLPGRPDFLLRTKFIWMLQTDSISTTPELSASAQKSRAGKSNCCGESGSQIQGDRLSMTYFCEQEALNMKQNTQGFWLCVFTSYGNAFSSQHQSKAGIWCTTIKRLQCDNNSLQRWGTSRRENLAIFPLLCHSSYSRLTQFEHGTCTGFACSFLSPCTQAIFPFYSLVSENLPLAFDPKSNNSNQTSHCLIPDFLWLLTFPTLTLSASLPQRMQAVTPFSAKCPPVLKCSLR